MSKKSKSITTDGVKFQLPTLSMTLKEITDLLEVRHNNAMRVVEKMTEYQAFGLATQIEQPIISGKGKKELITTYQLDKRQSMAVAAKLSTKFLMRVIDRWLELESAFANPPRAGLLQDKRSAHHPMMDALIDARTDVGKDTSYIHFMRENKLCNGVVTGNFKSVDESGLSNSDVALLAEVRRMNQSMLQMDLSYDERKKKLTVFAIKRRTKLIG